MTTFEWIDPQTTGILFPWAPVGAKKLGVRFESRSAVGVRFSTSNTLFKRSEWYEMVQIEASSTSECQKGVPSQGGQHREEHSVVHHVQVEHYQGQF